MTWQPIETAPKDGTRVLVFCPTEGVGGMVMEARCFGRGWGDPVHDEWDCNDPSHWMPLPEPPAPQEKPHPSFTETWSGPPDAVDRWVSRSNQPHIVVQKIDIYIGPDGCPAAPPTDAAKEA